MRMKKCLISSSNRRISKKEAGGLDENTSLPLPVGGVLDSIHLARQEQGTQDSLALCDRAVF